MSSPAEYGGAPPNMVPGGRRPEYGVPEYGAPE